MTPSGIEPATFRFVVQHLNHCATAVPTTTTNNQFVNIVKSHESTQPNMKSIIKTAANITEELIQPYEKRDAKQDGIQQTKARLGEFLKKKWKNKVMHGQYIRNIVRHLTSEEDTFLWLSKGDLKAETESEIVAAHDQALQTKYYMTKILNTEIDSKCRLCQQFDETIEYIISACPILAKEQYIKRYDSVCVCVHNYTSTYARKQRYNWTKKTPLV